MISVLKSSTHNWIQFLSRDDFRFEKLHTELDSIFWTEMTSGLNSSQTELDAGFWTELTSVFSSPQTELDAGFWTELTSVFSSSQTELDAYFWTEMSSVFVPRYSTSICIIEFILLKQSNLYRSKTLWTKCTDKVINRRKNPKQLNTWYRLLCKSWEKFLKKQSWGCLVMQGRVKVAA